MGEAFTTAPVFTLGDLFLERALEHPDRDCLVIPPLRCTYSELRREVFGIARSLLALGVTRGDRLAVLAPNSMETVQVLLAATLLGAPVVPVSTRFQAREIRHVVRNSGVSMMIVSEGDDGATKLAERLGDAFPSLAEGRDPHDLHLADAPHLRRVVTLGTPTPGCVSEAEFAGLASSVSDSDVDGYRHRTRGRDPLVIFYTSGTTADPKGCVLTNEAVLRTGLQTARRLSCHPGERFWCPLPMFHTGFSQTFGATLWAGGSYITMTRFDAARALDDIGRENVTMMFPAFPLIMQSMLNHADYRPGSFEKVRTVFNVAPADSLRDMQSRMPHTVQVSGYGMTEFGGSIAIASPSDDSETRALTQGLPFPGTEIEIRDPATGATGPQGERGEIVVRAPSLFEGYFADEEATRSAVDPDGWFHTGDLGVLDAAGRLTYAGRLKDMLKVGGENVAAIELESYLALHPAVSIAAVVGVPDPKYLEVPAAFVELRPGCQATADELIEFCRRGLASFKVPRHIRFVQEWPMSATKIQKFRLRDQLIHELQSDKL